MLLHGQLDIGLRKISMDLHTKVILILCFVNLACGEKSSGTLFTDLFKAITNALIASGANGPQRGQIYQTESNGISSSVYSALQTITKNDELECVPRLLCEAVAGGRPGTNRQINIDSYSLSKLLSYLQLGTGNSSPMLTFGKAVALGLSNRGDPYSCIINYPKCPKDEARLLYYLNNHRGGFFRFFDMKLPHQNYQYGQNSYYTKYPTNQHKADKYYYYRKAGDYLFRGKDNTVQTYAKKYGHSTISFPAKDVTSGKITFPSQESAGEPRIQTKPVFGLDYTKTARPSENFVFLNSHRYGKTVKESNFFPHNSNTLTRPASFVSDRLPSKFYFPEITSAYQTDFPETYKTSKGLFFPKN